MKPLSETELKAILDRFEATTQGEWKRHPNHRYWVLLPLPEGAVNLRNEADAQFCAHAHQDVPALLAEIARLKALTQWRPVKGFEEVYEVNRVGQVRRTNGRLMNPWANHNGYMLVKLTCVKLKKRADYRIHRLVAEAYLPNPENKPYINHIDNNPANNSIENLEWCTQGENIQHARNQGRMADRYWKGKRSPNASLTDEQIKNIRELRAQGLSYQRIADDVGTNKRTVERVIKGEAYAAI